MRSLSMLLGRLAVIATLFLGPLFTVHPASETFWVSYLKRYSYLLVLALSWSILFAFLVKVYLKNGNIRQGRLRAGIRILCLVLCAALAFVALELFRTQFPQDVFRLALGCIGLSSLSIAAYQRDRPLPGAVCEGLAAAALAYLTFLMTSSADPQWYWQPLLPSFGYASVLTARRFTMLLRRDQLSPFRRWKHVPGLLFALGPALTLALSTLGFLEPHYAVLCLIFPLDLKIANAAKAAGSGAELPDNFVPLAGLTAGCYALLLAALRLLYVF